MPIIPNVTIEAHESLPVYHLIPNEGYVLHDSAADSPVCDEEGNIIEGAIQRRYSSGYCSCSVNYDFSPRQLTVPVLDENGNTIDEIVTAYGDREFFAIERSKIDNPDVNIYGGGNNDHEVM